VTLVPTLLTPERAREVLAIRLGVTLDLASRHPRRLGPGVTSGVVILSLTPKALADQAQLRVGDVIERLGGHSTRDLSELGIAAARTAHVQTVSVVLRRGKEP
jgi:S1-C subfamily serine protease